MSPRAIRRGRGPPAADGVWHGAASQRTRAPPPDTCGTPARAPGAPGRPSRCTAVEGGPLFGGGGSAPPPPPPPATSGGREVAPKAQRTILDGPLRGWVGRGDVGGGGQADSPFPPPPLNWCCVGQCNSAPPPPLRPRPRPRPPLVRRALHPPPTGVTTSPARSTSGPSSGTAGGSPA